MQGSSFQQKSEVMFACEPEHIKAGTFPPYKHKVQQTGATLNPDFLRPVLLEV